MTRSNPCFPAAALSVLLAACGGGGAEAQPPTPASTLHQVSISWAASRESSVNSPGGGYKINISGQAPINCPYSGFSAPCISRTSLEVSLLTGTYTVTVSAYSALNGPGGTTGSSSAPSSPLTVQVP